MRRVILTLVVTAAVLVLLLGYKTTSLKSVPTVAIAPTSNSTGNSTGKAATTTGTKTIDGAVVQTQFGPVQVRVTINGGKLTDVVPLQLPSDRSRDQEIASYSVPILRSEALKAQSAQIDMVSGATYTSQGYIQSLQAALDQAHAA
ncbi:MAG TPA: FMN-binding protein [Streptosporangiaceae bacterium]|jgi:uncharacterized protein with FMN-binding domain|nr:FMN-binding protein [Streptosporangiaceae bacterium]